MIRILFFLLSYSVFAQQKITSQYIDSELIKAGNLFKNGKTTECIKANTALLEYSQSINYSKGIVTSSLSLANRYFFSGNHSKSLYYLKLAEKEKYTQENISTQISVLNLFSYNYINIGLYNEAINGLKEIVTLSDQVQDKAIKVKAKSQAYFDIGIIHRWRKRCDSAAAYTQKAIYILQAQKKLSPECQSQLVWMSLEAIELKLDQEKTASAEAALKLVESRSEKLAGNQLYKLYQVRGLLHCCKNENDLAIKNYEKAIALAKEIQNNYSLQYLYNLIIAVYKKKGDQKMAQKYLEKSKLLNDSLRKTKETSIEPTVKELIKYKEKKSISKIQFLVYYICAGVLIVIILLSFVIIKIRKGKKKLMQKEQETHLLNQKLSLAFNEVVQLAKNNDPEFPTRFVEVYPDFFPKLLQIEPQMQNSELKFCALLFLNFSSKDIATYTFVQPQSIQTRKNRLRKKLSIRSDEDIYVWMKNV
ncbi:hypothetical protein ACKW6Q_18710 [Chryseobacterium kwangjuense]|uniref:Anaphase-promoting complex subunit 5 domain-containing protein n=1 Tax=Chryseobacterium kwangjuense TaxID=267125 RepID=A0ABW9K6R7_9FLAO